MTINPKLSQFISKSEVKMLSKPNDFKAVIALLVNWGIIGFAFFIVSFWPNALSIALSVFLIAGRQLGLAILTHDCSHHALFTQKPMNKFVGHWLCGAAVNLSLEEYRHYHLKHHRYAGTDTDPDLKFVSKYPIDSRSLKRKLMRDFTGRTGLRDTVRTFKAFRLAKNYPWLIFHLILFGVLLYIGQGILYGLWWISWIFVFPALMRIRQIGEHGVALNRKSRDPRDNTHTTIVSWWERLLVAPNFVNYHLEHHLFAAVPSYNLSKVHNILKSRGYYKDHNCISKGYVKVLRRAVTYH